MQRVILKLDFRKSVKHMVGVLVICLDGFNAWFGCEYWTAYIMSCKHRIASDSKFELLVKNLYSKGSDG
jgi:hypothetical protein